MAKRGRPRKDPKLVALEGNTSNRNLPPEKPKNSPKPPVIEPKMPGNLGKIAQKHWKMIMPTLVSTGMIAIIDEGALAMLCMAYQRWQEAQEMIDDYGLTVDDGELGEKAHPAVNIALRYESNYKQLATEFGLTPGSRAKIDLPKPPEPEGAAKPKLHSVDEDLLD